MNVLKIFGSQIYAGLSFTKNFLYDWQLLDAVDLKTPVISVGNISSGGTGKTPIVDWLARFYSERMLKPVVVGRNYKALVSGIAKVDLAHPQGARYFGDEPFLLAEKNAGLPVYVGPEKWKAAFVAEKLENPDVMIIDDGFQHRALHRDLEIVLLDATSPISDYEYLPKGLARDSWSALKRADWIIITKVNLTDELALEEVRRRIPEGVKVIEAAYQLDGAFLDDAGKKVLGFAGLAKSESFRSSLKSDTFFEMVDFVSYPDHHVYTEADYKSLVEKMKAASADYLVTTEKDWNKVKAWDEGHNYIRPLALKVTLIGPMEELYADLDRLLSKTS